MGDEAGGEQVDGASGRWFEDLPVGLVVRHALTRTITEADNLQFCLMTHNPQPLHLDADRATICRSRDRGPGGMRGAVK